MAQTTLQITTHPIDESLLHHALVPGAVMLLEMRHEGRVDVFYERVRIRRQGGYCGGDIWAELVVYYASQAVSRRGFKTFYDKSLWPHRRTLSALLGRDAMAAPASLSRALESCEPELVREATPALLLDCADVATLLREPAVATYDGQGAAWQLFDYDPTVTTLRQRALPASDELPEAQRQAPACAHPRGHAGRKRGELSFRSLRGSEETVPSVGECMHMCAGAWLAP